MRRNDLHPALQELQLAADGELTSLRRDRLYAHLAVCDQCRARMAELEETIGDFERCHLQSFEGQIPPIAGPRALLSAQLAELAAQPGTLWQRFLQVNDVTRAVAYVGMAALAVVLAGGFLFQHFTTSARRDMTTAALQRGVVPDRRLTPGATRTVAVSDVCNVPHEEVVRVVPSPLRQRVLQNYGLVNVRAGDYEIDYLIAPELGGAEDIRNLWPEPYRSSIWNAHVKDALEEHLHQMVCDGKLDLPTAQRDISTDWIAAYKKLFHTDRPLSAKSELIRD